MFRFDDPDEHKRQIGYISYPGGEFRRITSDTNHYDSAISLTADGRMMAGTITRKKFVVYVATIGGEEAGEGQPIASGSAIEGISWTADGQVLAAIVPESAATAGGRNLRATC